MDYTLITLGYVAILLLMTYNIQANGHTKKPTPKTPKYSFLSNTNPPTPLPILVDKPIVPTELVRQKLLWVVGLGVGVGILVVVLPIPLVAKVSALIAGIGLGFLFALVRYNHWDEVMREARKPEPEKMTGKYALLYFVALGTFNVYRINIDYMLTREIHLMLMLASLLVFGSLCVGFLGEHLLLYVLHRQDDRSLTGDPS